MTHGLFHREAEVTRVRKELKQSHEQAEECRRRIRELDITTARDKSRLLAELHTERDGAASLVKERDDALEQLGTLKKEILEYVAPFNVVLHNLEYPLQTS